MSESQPKPNMSQLIQEAHEGVVQKQEDAALAIQKQPTESKIKTILAYVLVVFCITLAVTQYPRIHKPYSWPDSTNSIAIEADMEAVVGVIEAYRLSQGQYPDSLIQIRIPNSLENIMNASTLNYSLNEKNYVLTWNHSNGVASYNSQYGKINLDSKVKN